MQSFFSWQFFLSFGEFFSKKFKKNIIMLNIPFFKNIHQKLEKI